jgi:hypothetical protein
LRLVVVVHDDETREREREKTRQCLERSINRKLIGIEQLDCESAFFWQHIVEYLTQHDDYNDKLDGILPELVDLVDVIYEYVSLLCVNCFESTMSIAFIDSFVRIMTIHRVILSLLRLILLSIVFFM